MPDSNNPTPLSLSDVQAAEMRMRKALGLQPGANQLPAQQRPEQARQRHRFAQDGSVPVVVLNRSGESEPGAYRERTANLLAQVETERSAHAATRRTLHDAQAALQALRTRLTHAELAHADALAAERQARQQAEQALEAALAAAAVAQAEAPQQPEPEVAPPPVVRRRGRKPRADAGPAPAREAKPVKWWTPSFRAKTRKGSSPV